MLCGKLQQSVAQDPHQKQEFCCPWVAYPLASLLTKGTHRSAECLPERDTLLPTGEGRLLPLCRSSMDLLQGFDLSTELSTVLSTLSKSKLKQKRNAAEALTVHSHTSTGMCIPYSSWEYTHLHLTMGSLCKLKKIQKINLHTQCSFASEIQNDKHKMTNTGQSKRIVEQQCRNE